MLRLFTSQAIDESSCNHLDISLLAAYSCLPTSCTPQVLYHFHSVLVALHQKVSVTLAYHPGPSGFLINFPNAFVLQRVKSLISLYFGQVTSDLYLRGDTSPLTSVHKISV